MERDPARLPELASRSAEQAQLTIGISQSDRKFLARHPHAADCRTSRDPAAVTCIGCGGWSPRVARRHLTESKRVSLSLLGLRGSVAGRYTDWQMRRPESHVTGDVGLVNASRAFVAAGWACDRVVSDYGEDLIVQTTLGDVVDTFRTLVQVRTSRSVAVKDGAAHWRVKRLHALRWIRCAEPVLLVLWDRAREEGWYAIPGDQFEEYDLLRSKAKTVAVVFKTSASLTPQELERVAWSLRLEYYKTRILAANQRDADHQMQHENGEACTCNYRSAVAAVIFDILCTFGFVTPRGLSTLVRRRFRVIKKNIKASPVVAGLGASSPSDLERESVLLLVIAQIQEVAGVSVPTVVALETAPRLLFLLKGGAQLAARIAGDEVRRKRRRGRPIGTDGVEARGRPI